MSEIRLQSNFIPDGIDITTQLVVDNYTQPHKHLNYEILYVLDGPLEQILNGEREELSTGDCYFLSPSDVHSLKSNTGSRHRDILVEPSMLKQVLSLIALTTESFEIMLVKNKHIRLETEEILELESIAKRFSDSIDIYKKRCLGIMLLMPILNKLFESSEKSTKEIPDIVKRIMNYLNRNIFIAGGLPYIAQELGYNQSYVSRCFKKHMGITLTDYIKNLRLNYIAYYLKTSDYSLQKIADTVGIESLSYMNKIFKDRYEMTPMQYKKSNSLPHTSR